MLIEEKQFQAILPSVRLFGSLYLSYMPQSYMHHRQMSHSYSAYITDKCLTATYITDKCLRATVHTSQTNVSQLQCIHHRQMSHSYSTYITGKCLTATVHTSQTNVSELQC